MSRNALSALPESFSALHELHTLDISQNKVVVLPFGLGMLDDLTKFNFTDNPVRSPPLEITKQGPDQTLQYLAMCTAAAVSQVRFSCSVAQPGIAVLRKSARLLPCPR
jgi:Leucine-rich repeat (LRR) protein